MAIGDGVSAIASLAVTFGGFSPTAMDGVEASREQVERVEAIQAKKKEAARKRREMELARTSKKMYFIGNDGTKWTYVLIDEAYARLEECDTDCKSLIIPNSIDGKPVYALGMEACGNLDTVEEIICPDNLESIGACAFRRCVNLKRIAFPKSVANYSRSWVRHCERLEEMILPGELETISLDVFENFSLRKLVIGPCVHEIEPGAFQNTHLTCVEIDEGNPFIATDGDGIYTIDGKTLLALAKPIPHFAIREGCISIGKKACYGVDALKTVALPDSLVEIGEFAFSHSGIERIEMPASLRTLGEKSLYHCQELEEVILNDGLETIRSSAFADSTLSSLKIPASIQDIGASITVRTNIVHSGANCSIEIDKGSKLLFLDGEGGLYRREEDGIHLLQLIDREVEAYSVYSGTVVIGDYAFAHQDRIREVIIPEGVVRIGESAFRNCNKLEKAIVPDSVCEIGRDAFLDTVLLGFRIPANLVKLGETALITRGAHHGEDVPSLREIEVAPGNEHFYLASGMLCHRGDGGGKGDEVIVFDNNVAHVVIPSSVTHIADYAFNNASGIEYLELNKELKIIGTSGLATWCWIEHIHVEVEEPVEGRRVFDFRFPEISKSKHGISLGIGGSSWVNVPGIMAQYDICVINSHDYHSPKNTDSISIYEQVTRALDRLRDPILLTKVNRDMYDRLLRIHIVDICVDVARHDDRAVIDYLVDLGYVNSENLEEIILAVGRLQDAAMTGYLLELKRRRFGRAAFDFDL